MTTQPPAIPDELMAKWREEAMDGKKMHFTQVIERAIAERAVAWAWAQREPELQAAADKELEACCEYLESVYLPHGYITGLRKVRRPAPPTLREQALEALAHDVEGNYSTTKGIENDGFRVVTDTTIALIRKALKETTND